MTTIPDVAGKARGYRAWLLDDAGGLRPVGRGACSGQPWAAGVNTAAHLATELTVDLQRVEVASLHDAPQPAPCKCGLHACVSAVEAARRAVHCNRRRDVVYGAVDLWGRVIGHEWGWRAQHAQIVGLFVPPDPRDPRPVLRAARRYGVAAEPAPADLAGWLDGDCRCYSCAADWLIMPVPARPRIVDDKGDTAMRLRARAGFHVAPSKPADLLNIAVT